MIRLLRNCLLPVSILEILLLTQGVLQCVCVYFLMYLLPLLPILGTPIRGAAIRKLRKKEDKTNRKGCPGFPCRKGLCLSQKDSDCITPVTWNPGCEDIDLFSPGAHNAFVFYIFSFVQFNFWAEEGVSLVQNLLLNSGTLQVAGIEGSG
jgi:hypothetical protein